MASRPGSLVRVQSTAQVARDEAIQRTGVTRRAVIGGAAALTAGIAAFVSAIAPGRTLGASRTYKAPVTTTSAGTARTASSAPQMPPLASASQLGLAAEGSAPQPAPQPAQQQPQVQPPPVQQAPVQQPPPVVVSGGS
jgi:hypothetical protein